MGDDCSLRAWRAYKEMQAEWRREEAAAALKVDPVPVEELEREEIVSGFDGKRDHARRRLRYLRHKGVRRKGK